MVSRWRITLSAFLILMAILACKSTGNTKDNPSTPVDENAAPQGQPTAGSGGLNFGAADKWPDYIPADIPVLEGNIRKVMEAPGIKVRIFYEGLTQKQFDQYLKLLKQEGFNLQYIVYIEEGFPDNSEERLKRGEYDAVDITRGNYHLRVEYGEDNTTLDIYTQGFEGAPDQPTATVTVYEWPADIVGVVPQPEGCDIFSIVNLNGGGYQIMCNIKVQGIDLVYIQQLQGLGFTEGDKLLDENGQIVTITLVKGNTSVTVMLHPEILTLQVRPVGP